MAAAWRDNACNWLALQGIGETVQLLCPQNVFLRGHPEKCLFHGKLNIHGLASKPSYLHFLCLRPTASELEDRNAGLGVAGPSWGGGGGAGLLLWRSFTATSFLLTLHGIVHFSPSGTEC